MKLYKFLFEEVDHNKFNYGPVYHGGTWDGVSPIKTTGRGALGSGAYFTPNKSIAENYAKEKGGKVIETYLKLKKPLEIHMYSNNFSHPCVQALVKLGVNEEKAAEKVDEIEGKKGYMGKQISSLATGKGYDGLIQYFDGEPKEIVIWNSKQVKPITKDSTE
jgi:hypothetical protein